MPTDQPIFSKRVSALMANRHEQLLRTTLQFASEAAAWIEQDETGQALALLDCQYPNCAAAMAYFTAHPTPALYDTASALYSALSRYLDIRNYHDANRRWGNALVKAANLPLPEDIAEKTASVVTPDGQPLVLDDAALQDMTGEAINAFAEMVNLRGYGLWQIGRHAEALAFYHYAQHLFEVGGKTFGVVGVMLNISSLYDSLGERTPAVAWGRKALAAAGAAEDTLLIAEVAQHLAAVMRTDRLDEKVCRLYEQSVTGFKAVGNLDSAGDAQFDYALYRFECGDIEMALGLARDAVRIYEGLNETRIQLLRGWIKQAEQMLAALQEST